MYHIKMGQATFLYLGKHISFRQIPLLGEGCMVKKP